MPARNMPHKLGSFQPMRMQDRRNCFFETGIIILYLGLLMIIWGVGTSVGRVIVSKNPLLITGIAFFIIGFIVILTGDIDFSHHSNNDAQSTTPFRVRVYVDDPPRYSDCYVIDVESESGERVRPVARNSFNELPTYQDIYGGNKEDTTGDSRTVEPLNPPPGSEIGDKIFAEGLNDITPDERLNPKRKIWEKVQVDLKVASDGQAVWKDLALLSLKGKVTTATLRDANIS